MSHETRDKFTSRFGIIAATAGSAVGLGNLWGFPYKAGENGGGLFVLIYLICVLFVGIPVMMTEFILGREGKGGPMKAIPAIEGKKSVFYAGSILGTFTSFCILSFYCVIAGWAIYYFFGGLFNGFDIYLTESSSEIFNAKISNKIISPLCQIGFILLTVSIVLLGIKNGIEKVTKIMMPLLFVIIVLLVIYGMTTDGFGEAVRFLFVPTKLTPEQSLPKIALAALGQAFFSLSIGMGAVMTYARYVDQKENINKISVQVALTDTLVALLAGLAIFPIVFSNGLEPAEGAGLAFVTLPVAFAQMPLGHFVGVAFFFLLIVASITSSVSLMENVVVAIMESSKMNRKAAVIIVAALAAVVGLLCQIGFGYSSSILGFLGDNLGFLDQLDLLTMTYTIPLGAIIFIIFAGWRVDPERLRKQINNDKISNVYIPYVKYILPIFLIVLFVSGIM